MNSTETRDHLIELASRAGALREELASIEAEMDALLRSTTAVSVPSSRAVRAVRDVTKKAVPECHDPPREDTQFGQVLKVLNDEPDRSFKPIEIEEMIDLPRHRAAPILFYLEKRGFIRRLRLGVYQASAESETETARGTKTARNSHAGLRRGTTSAARVLSILEKRPGEKLTADDVAAELGVPDHVHTVRSVLSHLFRDGRIRREGIGVYASLPIVEAAG